ncbi:MAG: hypothetical protein AW11_00386 [Candidatus Accumulibacter regalis]|uniref:Uncharacterized protein n=1 Tax=Accumulibacter regalis TaxID=522306 RepID=A0A011QPQ8_ACCRE|nr:MAG: hypothetical protein AW11_00386 [Candidatus Accumulibacter regalis]
MLDAEVGQQVGKRRPLRRMKAVGGRRPLRLQIEDERVAVGKVAQPDLVIGTRRFENAQHESRHSLADGHLDLRQAIADRKSADQLAQRQQERRQLWRENLALSHVGNVAALALAKANQHGVFLGHEANREAGAIAIPPRRTMNRRVQLLGPDLAKMAQGVLEQALLGGHLRSAIEMLHAAPTANAEMRTAWRHAIRRRLEDAQGPRLLIGRLAAVDGIVDALPRQGAVDEDRLAVDHDQPAPLVVQRSNDSCGHRVHPQKNGRFYRNGNDLSGRRDFRGPARFAQPTSRDNTRRHASDLPTPGQTCYLRQEIPRKIRHTYAELS